MKNLYQAALMDHARNPVGVGSVPRGTEDAEAFNSACGDEIRLRLHWREDGRLERLIYELHGCAVSRASASMAAVRLAGKTCQEIRALREAFESRIGKEGFDAAWGDAQAFNGIEQYPSRIHCARLVWQAIGKAL
ncbi:MAG: SUF system NifU family Fe-S cluster assembly protein [Verrucomicrobiota bacterium]|jgi:nitrogen fixation NifU-like protein|nr:SUF system NifU family Fe-S cluster assembly protein [Verrucomicrobiota bacterium]